MLSWFDLPVTDLADAMSFYEGLLHWKYVQMHDSPLKDYVMIEVSGRLIGGLRRVKNHSKGSLDSPGPILYFTVPDLTASVSRAKELGAKLVGEEVDLGRKRGRYQWLLDREQNLIALWAAI